MDGHASDGAKCTNLKTELREIYNRFEFRTAVRVTSFANQRLQRSNAEDIGDIDVLVVDESSRTLLVIDAKAFVPNLTASEIAAELHDTFRPGRTGKRSSVDHLRERVAWVETNLRDVLNDLKLDDSDNWVVDLMFVLDRELISPHFDQVPILDRPETA